MNVTVVRPINNANTTYFHVHAAGCKDLQSRKYGRDNGWTFVAASRAAVIEDTYYDQIHNDHADEDPAQLIDEYSTDFTFHRCTANLPNTNPTTQENDTMTTTTTTRARHAVNPHIVAFVKTIGAEIVADGWIVSDDAEMVKQIPAGWIVRDLDDETITSPVLTVHEALRLMRDWDGEPIEFVDA